MLTPVSVPLGDAAQVSLRVARQIMVGVLAGQAELLQDLCASWAGHGVVRRRSPLD